MLVCGTSPPTGSSTGNWKLVQIRKSLFPTNKPGFKNMRGRGTAERRRSWAGDHIVGPRTQRTRDREHGRRNGDGPWGATRHALLVVTYLLELSKRMSLAMGFHGPRSRCGAGRRSKDASSPTGIRTQHAFFFGVTEDRIDAVEARFDTPTHLASIVWIFECLGKRARPLCQTQSL